MSFTRRRFPPGKTAPVPSFPSIPAGASKRHRIVATDTRVDAPDNRWALQAARESERGPIILAPFHRCLYDPDSDTWSLGYYVRVAGHGVLPAYHTINITPATGVNAVVTVNVDPNDITRQEIQLEISRYALEPLIQLDAALAGLVAEWR